MGGEIEKSKPLPDRYKKLIAGADPIKADRRAAEDETTDPQELDKIARRSKDTRTLQYIADNRNVLPETLSYLVENCNIESVRQIIASNVKTPKNSLEELAIKAYAMIEKNINMDENSAIIIEVVLNSNTAPETVNMIAKWNVLIRLSEEAKLFLDSSGDYKKGGIYKEGEVYYKSFRLAVIFSPNVSRDTLEYLSKLQGDKNRVVREEALKKLAGE